MKFLLVLCLCALSANGQTANTPAVQEITGGQTAATTAIGANDLYYYHENGETLTAPEATFVQKSVTVKQSASGFQDSGINFGDATLSAEGCTSAEVTLVKDWVQTNVGGTTPVFVESIVSADTKSVTCTLNGDTVCNVDGIFDNNDIVAPLGCFKLVAKQQNTGTGVEVTATTLAVLWGGEPGQTFELLVAETATEPFTPAAANVGKYKYVDEATQLAFVTISLSHGTSGNLNSVGVQFDTKAATGTACQYEVASAGAACAEVGDIGAGSTADVKEISDAGIKLPSSTTKTSTAYTVPVNLANDDVQELDEIFQVTVKQLGASTVADPVGSVNPVWKFADASQYISIRDNEGLQVTFAAASPLSEKVGGTFSVELSHAVSSDILLPNYNLAKTTAAGAKTSAADFTAGTDLAASQGFAKASSKVYNSQNIPLTADTLYDPDETVVASLLAPAAGEYWKQFTTPASDLTLPITESAVPDFSFETATLSAAEADKATFSLTAVMKDAAGITDAAGAPTTELTAERDVSINFKTVDVTSCINPEDGSTTESKFAQCALAGSDYVALNVALTFTAGNSKATQAVEILNDNEQEPPETFSVQITALTTDGGSSKTATATITDAESATLFISDSSPDSSAATETLNDKNLKFTVTLSHQYANDLTVQYTTADGSAKVDLDFQKLSTTGTAALALPAKSSVALITIPVIDDTIEEADETFSVSLVAGSAAYTTCTNCFGTAAKPVPTFATATATGLIREFEIGESTIVSIIQKGDVVGTKQSSLEGTATKIDFDVSLSKAVDSEVKVTVKAVDGTALAGLDYKFTEQTLTFAASTQDATNAAPAAQTVSVELVDDDVSEITETFTLQLSVDASTALTSVALGQNALSEGNGAAIGAIGSNDVSVVSIASAAGLEENGKVIFTVSLTASVDNGYVEVSAQHKLLDEAPIGSASFQKRACDQDNLPTAGTQALESFSGTAVLCPALDGKKCETADIDASQILAVGGLSYKAYFLDGVKESTLEVPVINDNCAELDETFTLVLSNAIVKSYNNVEWPSDGCNADPAKEDKASCPIKIDTAKSEAVGTIVDSAEDVTLSLSLVGAAAGKGITIEETGVNAVLSLDSDKVFLYEATIDVDFSNTVVKLECPAGKHCAEVSKDFNLLFPVPTVGQPVGYGSVTIPSRTKAATLVVDPLADDVREMDVELLQFAIVPATSNIVTKSLSLDLKQPAAANVLSFVKDTATIAEGGEGSSLTALQVQLTTALDTDFKFSLKATPGTAVIDQDFKVPTEYTFPQGQKVFTFNADIVDDDVQECDENFSLELDTITPITGYTMPTIQADKKTVVVTITDDEGLKLETAAVSAKEGEGKLSFTLKLTTRDGKPGQVSEDVHYTWSTQDGTAKLGERFNKAEGTWVWANANPTEGTADVTLIDDQIVQPNQDFTLKLVNDKTKSCGGKGLGPAETSATGTVLDNENGVLTATLTNAVEGESPKISLTLTPDGKTLSDKYPLAIAWDLTFPTVPADKPDYNPAEILDIKDGIVSGLKTFGTNALTAINFEFPTTTDDILEGDETFTVKLDLRNGFADTVTFKDPDAGARTKTVDLVITDKNTGFVDLKADREFFETDAKYGFTLELDTESEAPFSATITCTEKGSQKAVEEKIGFKGAKNEVQRGSFTRAANDFIVEDSTSFAFDECKITTSLYSGAIKTKQDGKEAAAPNLLVKDDDSTVLSIEGAKAVEGQDLVFKLALTNPVDTDVVVSYFTRLVDNANSNAANKDDFAEVPQDPKKTVTIAKGELAQTITVTTTDDKLLEGDQFFEVVIAYEVAEADKRSVLVESGVALGEITDNDNSDLTITAVKGEVDEGADLTYKVTLTNKVEADFNFNFAVTDTASLDRHYKFPYNSIFKDHAVPCYDFEGECTGEDDAKVVDASKEARTGTIKAGTDSIEVSIKTINDGERDGDNTLKTQLKQVLSERVKAYTTVKADKADGLIKDVNTDAKITIDQDAASGTATENTDFLLTLNTPTAYRRDQTVFLTSSSTDLYSKLDFVSFRDTSTVFPGGKKTAKTGSSRVPQNGQVVNTFNYKVVLFDCAAAGCKCPEVCDSLICAREKCQKDTCSCTTRPTATQLSDRTIARKDIDSVTIDLDVARSVLTNEKGGSGLQVGYRLQKPIRCTAKGTDKSKGQLLEVTSRFTTKEKPDAGDATKKTGDFADKNAEDQKLKYEVSQYSSAEYPDIKDMLIVDAATRIVFYEETGWATVTEGSFVTDSTQDKVVGKSFPVKVEEVKEVGKAVFVPSLCQAPIRAGPNGMKEVFISLVPGETKKFQPGSCFWYPEQVLEWRTEYLARAAGTAVLTNPLDSTMSVTVTATMAKTRPRVELEDRKEPYVLVQNDQADVDMIVADNLFLFECSKNGKKCCENVGGVAAVSSCTVDETSWRARENPDWEAAYNYDVTGVVRAKLHSKTIGMSRECFGVAPADNMYPEGFCVDVYTPDKPMVGYIQNQTVVQTGSAEVPVLVLGGTWISRERPYDVSVVCVSGCKKASASVVLTDANEWRVKILGSSVEFGDSRFVVIAKDRYYAVASYPIEVRTVRQYQCI